MSENRTAACDTPRSAGAASTGAAARDVPEVSTRPGGTAALGRYRTIVADPPAASGGCRVTSPARSAALDTRSVAVLECGQDANRPRTATNGRGHDTEAVTSMRNHLTTKCPACGSPDPVLRGGSCEHPFHDPRKRTYRPSGRLTEYLLSRGWERDDSEYPGECGESSDTVGYCEKPARWHRRNPTKRPLCAQHALVAQRWIDGDPFQGGDRG